MFELKEIEKYTNRKNNMWKQVLIIDNYCLTQKVGEIKNYFFIPSYLERLIEKIIL